MVKLSVQGMTCNHCVMAVKKALTKVPGVDQVVEVSLERGEAIVEGSAEPSALVAAVQAQGYEAAPVA